MRLRISRGGLLKAAVAAFLIGSTSPASAQTHFRAFLTHSQETVQGPFLTSTGGSRPESFGIANFVLNAAETEMSMTATIFNIDITGTQTADDSNDNLVAAHIHAPAPPGVNAGVRWGFFGTPDHDINPKQLVVTPFGAGAGGTFTSIWDAPEGAAGSGLAGNLASIKAGLSYINFHTRQFPGGEIRGQLLAVPEPVSMALFAPGLAVLGFLKRRKKTAEPEA